MAHWSETVVSVEIKRLDGKRLVLPKIVTSADLACVKQLVNEEWGIPVQEQRLVHAGAVLDDDAVGVGQLRLATSAPELVLNLVPTKEKVAQQHRTRAGSWSNDSCQSKPHCASGSAHVSTTSGGSSTNTVKIRRIPFDYLTIFEAIGTGSYKSVHRGKFRAYTDVAVLKFRPSAAHPNAAVREARYLTELTECEHPNLLRFFGFTTTPDGTECLVTEYASQGSLDAVLERMASNREAFTASMLISSAEQVRSGMGAIVSAGVLHRDLSLRNVLCFGCNIATSSISVKVCDFGRARSGPVYVADAPEELPTRWTAPEVLQRGVYAEPSEVWSFGVTMWEIVSAGKVPFADQDDQFVRAAVLSCNGNLLEIPFTCPRPLEVAMVACWAAHPERRPSFEDLREIMNMRHTHSNNPDLHKLLAMGFPQADALVALDLSRGNVENAIIDLLHRSVP